jgi:predicted RNA-binding Zn-ribbon protein involved in translation (DUF1610 family)
MRKATEGMNSAEMDLSTERTRCLHRVVRALHDGHCPSCGFIFNPEAYRELVDKYEQCPRCKFSITAEEMEAACAEFGPVMKKSLAVFEEWRVNRGAKVPSAPDAITNLPPHTMGI